MIKANKIEVQTVEHFAPDGTSLGFLNEYENTDLRCQIVEQKAEGYYLMFNDEKIEIKSNGEVDNWPVGLFDTSENLLSNLFKAQRKQRANNQFNK